MRPVIAKIISFVIFFMSVVSCFDMEDDMIVDNEIHLKAVVASSVLSTKTSGSVSPATEDPLYMGFVRIDETLSGYPETFKGQEALTATMEGPGNIKEINFNEKHQAFNDDRLGVRYTSWYPWYETAADEATGVYKYDPSTAQVSIPIDGDTDILYGSLVSGTRATGFNTIEYNHALCRYRIKAYAMVPFDENKQPIPEYMPDIHWGSVTSVSLVDMPDMCVMSLPVSGIEQLKYNGSKNLIAKGEPLLSSIPITMDEAMSVAEFIVAPPQDGILKINVETSKTTSTQTITIARDFKPGRHYDVILRFTAHGLINVEIEVGEWEQGPNVDIQAGGEVFYDLSTPTTANCYMISSANYNYCFNVTVKGNGVEGAIDGSDVSLNPGYLDFVWMDKCLEGKLSLMSKYPSHGRALISLTGNDDLNNKQLPVTMEGNALVGAYTDTTKNQLLWTWHLWISDHPQLQSYKNGFNVQDRDLGAVDYEPTTDVSRVDGLYYQWGRPTPFPIGRNVDFTISPSSDIPDVNAAISNPDVFYRDAVKLGEDKIEHLWGWRSEADEYVKTIYDPCPPGYRVPSKRLWVELEANNYQIESHNVKFSVIDGYNIYYPISGYYNGPDATEGLKYYWNGSAERTDKVGAFMWSATYDESSDNPYLMTYEYHPDGEHTMVTRVANDDGPALPLRCVSVRSTPHVEDLSAFQTANSYIVDEPGYYKFDVTTRGNGVGYLVSPGSAESIDVTEFLDVRMKDVAYVDYLWWQGDMETGNSLDTPPVELDFDGKPVDGYVTFHVDNFRKGNLILAAYDVRGNILWSWHIWLTDTPQLKKSKDYVVMDRFLGATYAPADDSFTDDQWHATFGLYYQWGRKDPFPIAASDGSAAASWWKYDRSTKQWSGKTGLDAKEPAESRSVAMSVAAPMTFHQSDIEFRALTKNDNFNYIFTSDLNIDNRCFGDMKKNVAENIWGYSSATGLGKTTSKTMYDPCPPGYSVAYYLVWASTSHYDLSNAYTYADGWLVDFGSYADVRSNKGIFLKKDTYDYTWYPFTGYMDPYDGTYKNIGSLGHFYTSTPANNGARTFFYDSSCIGQYVAGNYTGLSTTFALPVRCQKD